MRNTQNQQAKRENGAWQGTEESRRAGNKSRGEAGSAEIVKRVKNRADQTGCQEGTKQKQERGKS